MPGAERKQQNVTRVDKSKRHRNPTIKGFSEQSVGSRRQQPKSTE